MPGLFGGVTSPIFTWSTGSPSSKGPSIGGLFGKLASDFRLCPADARENTPLLPVK